MATNIMRTQTPLKTPDKITDENAKKLVQQIADFMHNKINAAKGPSAKNSSTVDTTTSSIYLDELNQLFFGELATTTVNYFEPSSKVAVPTLNLTGVSLKDLMELKVSQAAGSLDYCEFTDNLENINFWMDYGMESRGAVQPPFFVGAAHAFKLGCKTAEVQY